MKVVYQKTKPGNTQLIREPTESGLTRVLSKICIVGRVCLPKEHEEN